MELAGVTGLVFIGDNPCRTARNLGPFCGGEIERCINDLMLPERRPNMSSAGEPVGDLTAHDGALVTGSTGQYVFQFSAAHSAPANTYFSYFPDAEDDGTHRSANQQVRFLF